MLEALREIDRHAAAETPCSTRTIRWSAEANRLSAPTALLTADQTPTAA
ncbi:hypothetical protein ACFQ0M_48525 [Kitasatospora aburaviensis]